MGILARGLATSCLLSISMAIPAIAQESAPSSSEGVSVAPGEEVTVAPGEEGSIAPHPIEEITVVGQQSLFRLRLRIRETESRIYAFFNENNSHDKYDILCDGRRPIGTHIKRQICEPRFLRDLRRELTQGLLRGTGVGFFQQDLVDLAGQDFEILQNEMLELMAQHKEFANDLAELADLHENYEAHRKEMFGITD